MKLSFVDKLTLLHGEAINSLEGVNILFMDPFCVDASDITDLFDLPVFIKIDKGGFAIKCAIIGLQTEGESTFALGYDLSGQSGLKQYRFTLAELGVMVACELHDLVHQQKERINKMSFC